MPELELPGLPERPVDSHKGLYGRVLVVAGSEGMSGAGALASRAALRSGAGLVTWAVPKRLSQLAALSCVELLTLPIPETAGGAPSVDAREHLIEAAREADAVVLGPGLPVAGETGELLRLLVPEIHPPLVLDAGGLTAVGADWKLLKRRKAATVITPHPGEMGRLIGKTAADVQANREGIATKYAGVSGAVVVLKGAQTLVAQGDQLHVNQTGNPGMATAGSGDVLAGLIAGLIAQGLEAFAAARLGVHLHGLAGDLAAARLGQHGLLASDILAALPEAYLAYAART